MTKKINHVKRKEDIVEAAFHIIHYSGFKQATLRKIAQEAGLSLGSVQYFFPKQKDIYLFAVDVIYERFEERMRNVIQPEQGVFEYAVRLLKQIVQVNTKEERIENDIWVKFSIMATTDTEYQDRKNEFRKINNKFAKDILSMLQENHNMNMSINIESAANSLVIFTHGLVFESVIFPHLYDNKIVEKEIRRYLTNVCDG